MKKLGTISVYFVISIFIVSTTFAQEATQPIADQPQPAPAPPPEATPPPAEQPPTPPPEPVAPPTEPPPHEPIKESPPVTCPPPLSPPVCGPNEGLKSNYDHGCLVNFDCVKTSSDACPTPQKPSIECPPGNELNSVTDERGCITGYNCVQTAPHIGLTCPESIPQKPPCPDGNIVPTFDKGCLVGHNCIPKDCRQEVDATGFGRVVCEAGVKCPGDEQQASLKEKCIGQGGNPVAFSDPSGCTFYDCRFTKEEILPDPIRGHEKCPSKTETDEAVKSCKATGLSPSISFEGGCKIVKCTQRREERCKSSTPEARLQLEDQCSAKGFSIVKDVDPNGCAFYRCGETEEETCAKEVPAKAFSKCQQIGGEMVVKKDDDGCISYVNCITRGDERDAYVEPIEEVPEATELLAIAFKLEQLKIELDKLSNQAEGIANYYASSEDEDEERFNRVSSMFEAAKEKVDEIKDTIRSKLESLTKDDMLEIRRDIKQLKEVMLKDIVYMMLSNSDEVKETVKASKKISVKAARIEDVEIEYIEESGSDCGTNGLCFDRAFRVCKPVAFKPEGRHGPVITIIGLEGDTCIAKARLPEDMGPPPGVIPGINPPYEMTCKFKEYSFGVRGPEDFIPHCEGPMAELMKKFGPGGPPGGRGGPGGFEGPGGCKGPQECDDLCNSNPQVCMQWCLDNPDMCPQDKLMKARGGAPPFPGEEPEFGPPGEFRQPPSRGFEPGSGGPGGFEPPSEFGDRCECMLPSGTLEYPKGCPVLCSDYTDRTSCETQSRNGCRWLSGGPPPSFGRESPPGFGQPHGGIKCPDGICDEFERANPNACPQDCGGVGVSQRAQPSEAQPCVGCLNNGVCDIGECSECVDCLR